MSRLARFITGQLGRPSGPVGSLLMWRMFRAANGRMVRDTIRLLAPRSGEHVLDIGFGGGDSLLALAETLSDGRVAGVDYSPEMVRTAASRLRRRGFGSRAQLVLGDAARLPFADAAFGAVLTVNTVYFWPDLAGAFREIARVIAPGGRVAVAIRPADKLSRAPFASGSGFVARTAGEIEDVLRAAGFGAVSSEHLDAERRMSHIVVLGARA